MSGLFKKSAVIHYYRLKFLLKTIISYIVFEFSEEIDQISLTKKMYVPA